MKTDVNSWAGVGNEAVKEGLSALNTEVNKSSESPAGKFTMFIVAWKILGNDVIQFVVGVPMWLFGTCFFMYIFRKNCTDRRVLTTSEGFFKKKTYTVTTGCHDDYAAGYFMAYFIYCMFMALVIFA